MDRLLPTLNSWRQLSASLAGSLIVWALALILSVSFYSIDLSRAGVGFNPTNLALAYAVGFAPWLLLFPVVFRFAESEAKARRQLTTSLYRAAFLVTAAFGLIMIYLIAVYAPVTGQTPGQALESQQLTQWWWDASFFTLSYLVGRLYGQSRMNNAPIHYRIAVKSPDRVEFIDVADIHAVSAQGNYVALMGADRDILHRATMSEMETLLAPHGFVRIHRSHLVQPTFVRAIKMRSEKVKEVQLPSGQKLPVSDSFSDVITFRLETGILSAR